MPRRPHRRHRSRLEPLERRRHLNAATDVTFNFQPPDASVTPAGTVADTGAKFGQQGAYTYGWNKAVRSNMRQRNANADPRLDTLAMMQVDGKSWSWEAAVANGQYEVTITSGDAKYLDGDHRITAEGLLVMNGRQNAKKRFLTGKQTVTVTDGRLTLKTAYGSVNTKINSVRIRALAPAGGLAVSDTLPRLSVETTAATAFEGGLPGGVRLTRIGGDASRPLTVALNWAGTAGAEDVASRPTSATFAAGVTTIDLGVVAIDDDLVEPDETALVMIVGGVGYALGANASASVTIVSDDDAPAINVSAPQAAATEGGAPGVVRLTRGPGNASLPLTVALDWSGASDVASRPTTATFAAGVTTIDLPVVAIDDDLVEADATATVTIVGGVGYAPGPSASANVTIVSDDVLPSVNAVATLATATEGGAAGNVRLTRGPGNASLPLVVMLNWTGATDLVSHPTTATFAAGVTTIDLPVVAIDDDLVEANATATLTVVAASGYTLGAQPSASLTIVSNDLEGAANQAFTNITWTGTAAPPASYTETTSVTVNGRIYLIGGFTGSFVPQKSVYRFDGTSWQTMANAPRALTHTAAAVDGDDVWFVGGYVGKDAGSQTFGTADVWVYHTLADTWTAGPALPAARASGNLVRVDRTLYYFGGETLNRTATVGDAWSLDLDNPGTGWQSRAAMPLARSFAAAVNVDGKIIVLGGHVGYDANLVAKNDIQVYDPTTNAWTVATAKLPAVRSYAINSTQLVRGKIVMVTGETGHNQPVNTVWSIDPATLQTTVLGTFPDARLSAASGILNDKFYLFGGYKGSIATMSYVGSFV